MRPCVPHPGTVSVGDGSTLEPVEAGAASHLTVLVWGAAEPAVDGAGPALDPWALLTAGWPAISAAAVVACKEALRGVPLCKCGW